MKNRDHSLDAIRGIAIFIMIFANAAPAILPEPHPFIFRVIDSLAAPVFIALAGFGLSYALYQRKEVLFNQKLFFRGLLTVCTGALIDVFCWEIMPFVGFDVLYLIGFSLMIAAFFGKVRGYVLAGLVIAVVAVGFSLQYMGYYQHEMDDVKLDVQNSAALFRHWDRFLVDGWFPLFPWLAIFVLGYLGGRKKPRLGRLRLSVTILLVLIFNFTLFFMYHQDKFIREGYSELFYPADLIFLLHTSSVLLIIWIHRTIFRSRVFALFRVLGKCSLFIYIIHCVFISCFIQGIHEQTEQNHWLTYALFYLIIFVLAYFLQQLKKVVSWDKMPYLLRFVFGS